MAVNKQVNSGVIFPITVKSNEITGDKIQNCFNIKTYKCFCIFSIQPSAIWAGQSDLRQSVTLVCLASSSHEKHLQAYPFNPLLAAFIPET